MAIGLFPGDMGYCILDQRALCIETTFFSAHPFAVATVGGCQSAVVGTAVATCRYFVFPNAEEQNERHATLLDCQNCLITSRWSTLVIVALRRGVPAFFHFSFDHNVVA
eukprot:gb/GECG01009074.1/.p1 GENE.gb/GECG01009074.1/~~gb/GECG01009074.1/.p1  ORF type:complete len:109 (+),score=8.03 gb/GECG01009074.1/:1-327(+)